MNDVINGRKAEIRIRVYRANTGKWEDLTPRNPILKLWMWLKRTVARRR